MKKLTEKAFTLVELLIVIGIIGVLATTLLLNMNPAEAQKKSRDTKRLKDLSTLQSAIEGMINDGVNFPNTNTVEDRAFTGNNSCATNWTGSNLCNYLNTVPVDPSMGSNITTVHANGTTLGTGVGRYRLNYDSGARYKLSTQLESTSNSTKLDSDNGLSDWWYEVFNNRTVAI